MQKTKEESAGKKKGICRKRKRKARERRKEYAENERGKCGKYRGPVSAIPGPGMGNNGPHLRQRWAPSSAKVEPIVLRAVGRRCRRRATADCAAGERGKEEGRHAGRHCGRAVALRATCIQGMAGRRRVKQARGGPESCPAHGRLRRGRRQCPAPTMAPPIHEKAIGKPHWLFSMAFSLVGVTGFEPATTRPPDAYSNRAELHPARDLYGKQGSWLSRQGNEHPTFGGLLFRLSDCKSSTFF